jgi:glutathione synthase
MISSKKVKKLAVVMDPIADIQVHKDTTLAILLAAKKRGWQLYYLEPRDLFLAGETAMGRIQTLNVFDDVDCWYHLNDTKQIPLAELDVILMRKDPPFDNQYIYCTYILEAAQRQGCLVVNDPQSLRDCNEKIFATQFPQCFPPLIVSSDPACLKEFYQEYQDVIFKPLDGMGGAGVFRCRPNEPNLGVILEVLTQHGRQFIMGQRYIPEITQGDKRILVVDGKAIPYVLARIPARGETRGNLAVGGSGYPQPLSEHDQWIVDQVTPTLLAKKLLFVGLDVIGDYLTEINVTSPTCAREIDRTYDTDIGGRLLLAIEERLIN